MRNSHKEMLEILSSFEEGGLYFARVARYFQDTRFEYHFGVSKSGYNTVKRIIQLRPFDSLSKSTYRYFWYYGCGTNKEFYLDVQFEQGKNVKSLPVKSEKQFGANLRWFLEAKSPEELKHLEVKA